MSHPVIWCGMGADSVASYHKPSRPEHTLAASLARHDVITGFPRAMATDLALQTVLGTCKYAMESKLHPAILRNDITSPGGTTSSAL
jgi:pyrroline-5-carboxylate reductase